VTGAQGTVFRPTDEPASRFEREALPHLPRLYPAALRMTDDPDDAGELVQETFAHAYREYPHRRPGTDTRAWLYRILLGVHRATRRRRPGGHGGDAGGHGGDAGGSPAGPEDLERLSDRTVVRALHELPFEDRVAVYLRDVEGFGYDEIATITQAPVGAVVRRLTDGRRLLRRLLERSSRAVNSARSTGRD
jgi:RNA polymerase sigma-70 factor (ECF subfamily)